MTLKGIDISHHQTVTPDLTGLSFLFARASIGTQRDERYTQHIANARKAGLVTGAYHFNWDTIPVADQVRVFLAAAVDADLLVVDVEGANAFSLSQTRAFIAGVKAKDPLHRKMGLYMSDSGFYMTAGQDFNWVARWSPVEPARDWSFWQYRGSPLDLDRFAGTAADLAKMAGIPIAPDTSTEDAMLLTDVTAKPGTATITADGPCWRVADDARVEVQAGATWDAVGTARYHHTTADPDGSLGYLIRARAADGELHIVAQSRCSFVPTPLPKPDCTDAVEEAVADALVADRAKAYVAYKP